MPFWRRKQKQMPVADGTLEGMIKVSGGGRQLDDVQYDVRSTRKLPKRGVREWEPRALNRGMQGANGAAWQHLFSFNSSNKGAFYRYIRDSVPIISAGVQAWVRLCATRQSQLIEGNAAQVAKARNALTMLDGRILELPYGRGSGLNKLIEACYLELFTTGRFAGEAVLTENGDRIDHFRSIDPYRVSWKHEEEGWVPYIKKDEDNIDAFGSEYEKIDPKLFYYGTLGTDLTNPSGIEPLASIPFVAEVEQLMLEDMARSSHNAGVPRLQVKMNRPERFNWEGDSEYTDRANRYFQDMVNEFRNLEPDQNVFTWGDVEVKLVGGGGNNWNWRLNREQVIEDVITGLKLFPWVLGRSHKTTQNWVRSQYDMLMQIVSFHQSSGIDLLNWLCNLELKLQGIEAHASHRFEDHPDPFRLERVQAESVHLTNVDRKVERGYISKDDGARELGYVKAFQKDGTDS